MNFVRRTFGTKTCLPPEEFRSHHCTYRIPNCRLHIAPVLNCYLNVHHIQIIRSGKLKNWEDVRKYLAIQLSIVDYQEHPEETIVMEVLITLLKLANKKKMDDLQVSIFLSLMMDTFRFFTLLKPVITEEDTLEFFSVLLAQNMKHFQDRHIVECIRKFFHNTFLLHYSLFRHIFAAKLKLEFFLVPCESSGNQEEKNKGRLLGFTQGPLTIPVGETVRENTSADPVMKTNETFCYYGRMLNNSLWKILEKKKNVVQDTALSKGVMNYAKTDSALVGTFGMTSCNTESRQKLQEKVLYLRKYIANLLVNNDPELCSILAINNKDATNNLGTCPPPNSCRDILEVKETHSEPRHVVEDDKETKKRLTNCHSTPLPGNCPSMKSPAAVTSSIIAHLNFESKNGTRGERQRTGGECTTCTGVRNANRNRNKEQHSCSMRCEHSRMKPVHIYRGFCTYCQPVGCCCHGGNFQAAKHVNCFSELDAYSSSNDDSLRFIYNKTSLPKQNSDAEDRDDQQLFIQ